MLKNCGYHKIPNKCLYVDERTSWKWVLNIQGIRMLARFIQLVTGTSKQL